MREKRSQGSGRNRWDFDRRKQSESKWVDNREKESLRLRGNNHNWRFTDATTFFLSNLPSAVKVNELRTKLMPIGTLVDVFIAARKDKHGHKFGFARYNRVKEEEEICRKLNKVVVEGRGLFARVAKFKRKDKELDVNHGANHVELKKKNTNHHSMKRWIQAPDRVSKVTTPNGNKSFADAVKGRQEIQLHKENEIKIKICPEENFNRGIELKDRFIGEVKEKTDYDV